MKIDHKLIKRYAIKSRKVQLRIKDLLKKKKIKFPVHLALGHEIVAAKVKYFTNKNDKLILSHRNTHYSSIFSKNYIKSFLNHKLQFSKGSMNFTDPKNQIIYTSSILGNNLAVAAGVAKSLQGKKGISVCVTGDGAIEEGSFYETLLLSKHLKLPLFLLIENNNMSMATKINERRPSINLKHLANSLKIDYFNISKKLSIENFQKFSDNVKICRKGQTVICEYHVETIGDQIKNNRIINYHHGKVKLERVDKFIIKSRSQDILKNYIETF